jgi:MoxR-like ATPase
MDKDEALHALFGSIIDEMKESSNKKLDEITKSVEDKAEALEKKMTTSLKRLDDLLDNKPLTVNFGTVEKPANEITHKAFDKILKVLQSTKRKDKHIMLVGGAGGGKTHLAGQIAKALKIPFYPMSVGLQTTKSDLLGFINATGGYNDSPVRKAYENGGLLLLDEFDATHAGVVTILNSLLANGHATFPDKIVEKHKDFICMCACNTYGRGGNIDYIGRNKLDGATLDRFLVIDVDYDKGLERNLANNDDWVDALDKIRENIAKQGIKMIISPRASMDGADLLEAGFDIKDVMDMVVYKGCDEDIKKKITNGVALSRIRKRPNRKTESTELVPACATTEVPFLLLDFDLMQYQQKRFPIDTVISKRDWNSDFSIFITCDCFPELQSETLFINTKEEIGKLDGYREDDINNFIENVRDHYRDCPFRFDLRIQWKGTIREYEMGC